MLAYAVGTKKKRLFCLTGSGTAANQTTPNPSRFAAQTTKKPKFHTLQNASIPLRKLAFCKILTKIRQVSIDTTRYFGYAYLIGRTIPTANYLERVHK